MTKVIKTRTDYEMALASVDRLIALDPEPGTAEADELELLSLLIRDYEGKTTSASLPDPIDAILFRMDQLGMSQRDLVPFIGSRARVSEILSRKRPLTLGMRRALHVGLGIPAVVLLRGDQTRTDAVTVDFRRFPLREMARLGWLTISARASEEERAEALAKFLSPIIELRGLQVLTRMSRHVRSDSTVHEYALMAWTAKAIMEAKNVTPGVQYLPGCLNASVLRGLVHLSTLENGPTMAKEYLSQYGITLVIVEHLPKTHLDGAVFFLEPGRPVIALTLRYDRLDSFWFTLFHELGHLVNDFEDVRESYFDDLDSSPGADRRESIADQFAQDTLVPPDQWAKSPLKQTPNPAYARDLARQLGIHVAIVAGRSRRERKSYRILSNLVGHGELRKKFELSSGDAR